MSSNKIDDAATSQQLVEAYFDMNQILFFPGDSQTMVTVEGRYKTAGYYVAYMPDGGVLLQHACVAVINAPAEHEQTLKDLTNLLNGERNRITYCFKRIESSIVVSANLRMSWIEVDDEGVFFHLFGGFTDRIDRAMYQFDLLFSVSKDGVPVTPEEAHKADLPELFGRA